MKTGWLSYLMASDRIAEGQRRDDEEFRAWHRRPDALPLPPEPTVEPASARPAVTRIVRRLVRQRLGGQG